MFSLILSACGKSPVRRDDNNANINIESLKDESIANTNTNPKDKPSEPETRAEVGARVGVGVAGGVLGTAILLTVARLVLFACRDSNSLPGKSTVLYSTIGTMVGGAVAGGIVGRMSGAAGDDGWGKVMLMLNAGIAGFVAGVVVVGGGLVLWRTSKWWNIQNAEKPAAVAPVLVVPDAEKEKPAAAVPVSVVPNAEEPNDGGGGGGGGGGIVGEREQREEEQAAGHGHAEEQLQHVPEQAWQEMIERVHQAEVQRWIPPERRANVRAWLVGEGE